MSTTPTERPVTSVVDLLQAAELTGIRTYQVVGVRAAAEEERADDTKQDLQVMVKGDAGGLETRVLMTVNTPEADLRADVGALYTFRERLSVEKEIVAEFVEKVGVMAVFPFLRESILTTATRLGVAPPVLGLLRAGQFHVTPPDADPPVVP